MPYALGIGRFTSGKFYKLSFSCNSMIEYYKRTKKGALEKLANPSLNSWIKVVSPDEKEIDFLIDKFGIEKDLLLDGLDLYEIPRVEQEGRNVYIFLRVPAESLENPTYPFLIIVTKNNLITVSRSNLDIFDKLSSSDYLFTDKKSRSVLQILFYVFRDFNLSVRRILKEVKGEKRNLLRLSEKDIFNLVLKEDTLNDYLSSFSPLIDMYNRILKITALKFKEDEKDFIEDLVIDLNQTFNTCKAALRTISNMRDYYSTTLTNNLNKVITLLTVFTIFLTIPAVISSIYGMNIILPFQHTPGIFLLLGGITILIWIIAFMGFKKKNLI